MPSTLTTNEQNPVTITRRPATDADREFARQVHHQAYRDVIEQQFGPWCEEDQDRFFAGDWRDAQFEIILADGQPCGYACIEDRDEDLHVRELVILPAYQNRGIGSTLLREVVERARQRRVPVHLGTFHKNRAVALYRRLGFREIGQTDIHILMQWKHL
jgi:ribosomal protein S18 acetylase RimI-like enzyme